METRLQSKSFDTLDDLLGFRVQKLWSKAGISKLQLAGQMQPAKPFHPALEAILSNDEKNYQNFADLVECHIS